MSSERDSTSESGGGHHNIVLTPEEKKVFGQLFNAADSENLGVVTGELAVKFFEKSGLSPRVLGEIWGIADTDNRGLLTKVGFSVALRLIGQAQSGQHPRPELAQQPGPLPRFEGVHIVYPPPPPPPAASPPLPSLQNQPAAPPGAMIRVPPLSPQDVEKFSMLFEKSGAVDGTLQGNLAREIFQRSKLATAVLIQIWNLADRQQRGALSQAEFVVAMHLITCCKNGSLPVLPQLLPPGLYDVAAGRPPTRNGPDRRPNPRGMPNMPPVPQIPRQFSGPAQRAQSPLAKQYTPNAPAPPVQRDNTGWAISPQDKQRFDAVYLTVDKANPNVITGEEAVPFFSNSKLNEEVLAQIWDLADINKAGQLNRDEFAIAMYLIVQQRSNPGVPLPDNLPPNLIPPSMRQQGQMTGPLQPTSPFDPVSPPAPKSAADDLFGLDSFTTAQPQAGPVSSGNAGSFDNDMWSSKDASPARSPAANSPGPSAGIFGRPTPTFVPTSSFGQSIMPTSTGGSNHSGGANRGFPQQRNEMDDLLGDADPEISKKLTNETTELANLSNQIGNLTKQTHELKQKRASTEQDLNSLNAQKQTIEAQLSQLRSAYEKEAAHVKRVEDQLAASRADTARATAEYQKIETEYNQLQYKKQEISSQLEADRRENENLKERMNHLNIENRNLREELLRLGNQARREKGLVAIKIKQAAQSESDRERLKGNIDDVQNSSRSNVTSPVPPGSPTPSQSSHTNPFYRKSPPPENTFAPSPFAPVKNSMDDVFGPAFGAATPPPSTSFSNKAFSASGPSASEGAPGEHSTPPTSPPASSYDSPHMSEAPPPAAGNQMNSSFLPLAVTRADSTTSSIQVNPSVSVRGDNEFSRPDTPTNWMNTTATAETPGKESVLKAEVRRDSFSVRSDAGTESSAVKPSFPQFDQREQSKSPYAQLERNITGTTSGGDENKSKLEKVDSFQSISHVPGAFPSNEQTVPIKPTATGESNMSNRSRTSNMSKSAFGPDPFNMAKDDTRSQSSKADFDDAFRSFSLGRVSENNTGGSGSVNAAKFDKEFPPIAEIHNDSDSDSETGGFDDNFTSTSPAQTHAQLASAKAANNDQSQKTPTESTVPPTANAQQPPPSYGQTTAGQEKSGFPAEFSSLLPSRSDPMNHGDALTPGGSNAVTQPPKLTKDEFEDAFGDLADAELADDKTDNDFNTPSAFDDFDPVFDNPKVAPGTAIGNEDDFAKFTFNIDEPTPSPAAAAAAVGDSPVLQAKPATSEDWDRIFADFGNGAAGAPKDGAAGANVGQAQANGNNVGEQASSGQSGTDPGEGGGVSLNATTTSPSDVPASLSSAATIAPAAEAGGVKVGGDSHSQDEKIQQLTVMGFNRESSLNALEKSGWNLDRAANTLLTEQ